MTNCSRSNAAIAPKIMKQVQTKLKDIQTVYPGTKGCCIISNGECLMCAFFPLKLHVNKYLERQL